MNERRKEIPDYLPGRRGLMLTLLLVLVAVQVATVTAVVMSQRVRTEEALELHTRQLLRGVANGTRENALTFLTQTQNVVQLTEKLFVCGLLSLDRPDQLERYFLDQLAIVPQIDGLYFGDPDGQFLFTKRSSKAAASGYETKIIDRPDGVRRVRKIWRDEHYAELERKVLADDVYDPRVRPWYLKAKASAALIWSDPYIFFTSRAPGITAAARVSDESGKLVGIAGADVELGAISDFLAVQQVAADGGGAVLVHQNGDVLAYPARHKLQVSEGDRFRLVRLHELDPITAQAAQTLEARYPDLATLKDSHFDSFVVNEKRIVTMFVPFSGAQQWPWLMGVYAPEENFAGTIREGQQQALVLAIATSIVIILAAFTLSPALIRPLTALQERASHDPLSHVMNRRSFEELVARRFMQAQHGARALSVIMLDIDELSLVNEKFGVNIGNEVIVAVAGRIQHALAEHDSVARYDGGTFAVLLRGMGIDEANAVAERVSGSIESLPITTSAESVSITISLGVAELNTYTSTVTDLLAVAEYRMRETKRKGHNQVVATPAADPNA